MKKDNVIARLTMHRLSEMTPEGRKALAEWLRNNAKFILKEGKNCSKVFTAKYIIP